MIDIRPAAERMSALVTAVRDDQLAAPTPCPESSLGDLIDHVRTLALAFRDAARKERTDLTETPPQPTAANLAPGWRDEVTRNLTELTDAWRDHAAWDGMTAVGGLELPGTVAGLVALDELVVHGWDIAVASGQPYEPTLAETETVTAFVASFDAPRDGSLFGPIVSVPDTAPPLDRLLGLTGRDPRWQPAG